MVKVKDRVRILVGVYAGKEGVVEVIADAPVGVGVKVHADKVLPLTWFKPNEIELVK